MRCRYQVVKQDVLSFHPQECAICTRHIIEPPFPECDEESCAYIQEKWEQELRNNPPPSPGFRRCPYMRPGSGFECSMYLNNCSRCGLNPAVKEQREKELAEQKRLKEESKLSYKIKQLFKKERKED